MLFGGGNGGVNGGDVRKARHIGEEIPSALPWMLFGGGNGGVNGGDVRKARDVMSHRRIRFYSSGGECYARDRSGQWHWVDWRLC
jgi:hypothetical protein